MNLRGPAHGARERCDTIVEIAGFAPKCRSLPHVTVCFGSELKEVRRVLSSLTP